MDIARNRTLRQALVVRPDVQIERRLQVNSEMMVQSHIAYARRIGGGGSGGTGRCPGPHWQKRCSPGDRSPRFPGCLPPSYWHNRRRRCRSWRCSRPPGTAVDSQADLGTDAQVLAGNLVRGYTYDNEMVMLHSFAPPLTVTPGRATNRQPGRSLGSGPGLRGGCQFAPGAGPAGAVGGAVLLPLLDGRA